MNLINESLNKLGQPVEEVKKERKPVDKELEKVLKESAAQVDTRYCRTMHDATVKYQMALQEAIEKINPDKSWHQITGCDIYSTLLETKNDVDAVIERILTESKVQPKQTTNVSTKTRKTLNEAKSVVKKQGNKSINEGWRGCPGIKMVYHGDWADPDLVYKGYTFNYWDIEDALWNDFLEYNNLTEKDVYDGYNVKPEFEDKFNEYVCQEAPSYLDDYIANGAPKTWHKNESLKLTEEPIYDLRPQHDSRQSFYSKAVVDTGDAGDKNKLYSYNTLVAEIKDGKPVVYGTYSATTLRHIKEWLKQNGFKADTAKQILADYGAKNESCKEESCKEEACKEEACKTEGCKEGKVIKRSQKKLKEDYNPFSSDTYYEVIEDLVDRAKSFVKEGNSIDDAIDRAIDDGLIYYQDILAIAVEYGVIDFAMLQDSIIDTLKSEMREMITENESLKESKSLKEGRWTYDLKVGPMLRDAIDAEDLNGILAILQSAYQELADQGLIDEDDCQEWVDEIDAIDEDGEDAEDEIDFQLGEFYDLCDNLRVWIPLEESLKESKKSLVEGTSNFWSMDKLPLLVFEDYEYIYDQIYDEAEEELESDEAFEYMTAEEQETRLEELIDEIWSRPEYAEKCLIDWDSDEGEELRDDIKKHNAEMKDKYYYDRDENEWSGEEVEIKPGYYEAAQLYVNDRYMGDEELEDTRKFFEEMKNKYGLEELEVAYRFSNGETGYHRVKRESLKESKEIDRKFFKSLIKYDTFDPKGNYAILNDGNFVRAFHADNDEEAKKEFRKSLGESLKESVDTVADFTIGGNKYHVTCETKQTRNGVKETATIIENGTDTFSKGDYKWYNRPWQRFKYAEALRRALENGFGTQAHAEDAVETASGVVDAVAKFAERWDKDESLKEDTVKQGSQWVNKGKEGTHGKFKTKKEADAQRKAMFARGYKA